MSLDRLLEEQDGVISRAQVLALGCDDDDIARKVRRREWARVHRGIFVDHTGPITSAQRAWAAVLHYAPAALYGPSVLAASGLTVPGTADGRIHVAVAHERRVAPLSGAVVHRLRNFEALVHPVRTPPQLRWEHSVLHTASAARGDAEAVAVVSDACRSRRTTPARLRSALGDLDRLPRRRFLDQVLADVAEGVHSVLEHRYLVRVERAHGLPSARRQARFETRGRRGYRDAEYLDGRVVVELDGRLGHDLAEDRWDDLDRDLDTALAGAVTIRLGWRQVLDECRTATVLARMLMVRGWGGAMSPCGPSCAGPTAVRGDLRAPGA